MSKSTKSLDFFEVEVPEAEVLKAVIEAAKKHVTGSAYSNEHIDETFDPVIKSDGYRGFKVYFKKDMSGGT